MADVVDIEDITPSVADVGAILFARTKEGLGGEAGTFTANTRPTAEQVESLAERSARVVALKLGLPHSRMGSLVEHAKQVVATRTAWQVEIAYWPSEVEAGDSTAEHLRAMFEQELEMLEEAARDNQPGGRRSRTMRVGRPW